MKRIKQFLQKYYKYLIAFLVIIIILFGYYYTVVYLNKSKNNEQKQSAQSLYQQAKTDYSNKDYIQALNKLENAINKYPDDPKMYEQVIRIYLDKNNIENAQNINDKALKKFKDNKQAEKFYYFGALILKQKQEYKKAIQSLQQISNSSENNEVIILQADLHLLNTDTEKSKKALDLFKQNTQDKQNTEKSEILNILLDYSNPKVLENFQIKVLKDSYKSTLTQDERDIFSLSTQLSPDTEYVKKENDKDNYLGRIVIAKIAYNLGYANLAIKITNEVLQKVPNYYEALLISGLSHSSLKDFDKANQAFEKAELIQPQNYKTIWYKARIADLQKDQSKAQDLYSSAVKISNQNDVDLLIEYAQKLYNWKMSSLTIWKNLSTKKVTDTTKLNTIYINLIAEMFEDDSLTDLEKTLENIFNDKTIKTLNDIFVTNKDKPSDNNSLANTKLNISDFNKLQLSDLYCYKGKFLYEIKKDEVLANQTWNTGLDLNIYNSCIYYQKANLESAKGNKQESDKLFEKVKNYDNTGQWASKIKY